MTFSVAVNLAACAFGGSFAGKTMVCLGDSITSGYGAKHAYPERLKRALGLKKVYNHGIPGSTLTEKGARDPFVDRFSDMEDADIVAVLFAGNDATFHVEIGTVDDDSPDTVCGALNILITGLKEKYPDAYIFFITPFINENCEAIRPYVAATREACKKHGIDLLDLFREEIDYVSSRDTVDGCHPTQDCIDRKLTPLIADFLRQNYR